MCWATGQSTLRQLAGGLLLGGIVATIIVLIQSVTKWHTTLPLDIFKNELFVIICVFATLFVFAKHRLEEHLRSHKYQVAE